MKHCKRCRSDSIIYDSRIKNGAVIRRRKCKECSHKWMTIEVDLWLYMGEKDAEIL